MRVSPLLLGAFYEKTPWHRAVSTKTGTEGSSSVPLQPPLTGTFGVLGYCQGLVTVTVVMMMTMMMMPIGITPFGLLAYTAARPGHDRI